MKVFISSTYEDLKEERKEAIEYIDRIGNSVAMEKFFASDHKSKETCLRKLQECDAAVLILGFKYGSMDEVERISITEIEYTTAKTLGLPVLAFLKRGQDSKWRPEEPDPEKRAKLLSFKSRVDAEKYRVSFTNPQDLCTEIAGAIHNYEREHGLIGTKVSAFSSHDEFFRPFRDKTKLFNHLHSLVGRKGILTDLDKFVESDKRVGILYGRGGIGKSKLLFEFGGDFEDKHPEWKIRFVREGIRLSDEALKQLPAGKCLIIIDDAHRRGDLKTLLAVGQQQEDRIKVIFSTRPQGTDYLRGTLTMMGYDPEEIEELPEVGSLGIDEMKELAEEILGGANRRLVESLVGVAKDSPLVLVIGGKLVAEGEVAPAMLERHDKFQRVVFDRYQDVFAGQVSDMIGKEMCRAILSLLSAISPVRPQEELFQKTASEFLGIDRIKLIDAVSILESSGVLLRRGYSLRITPDVLSDHILHKACINEQGEPTGYTSKVFNAFSQTGPDNVLFNLAELDWRITKEGKPLGLLGEVWQSIWSAFREGTNLQRTEVLKSLEGAAHLQPEKTLEIVEYAIRNPSERKDDEPLLSIYEFKHQDVLETLPELLRGISYNLNYLPRCADILWRLGRDDARATGSRPEHPMRILIDLAAYDSGKPVAVNRTMTDAVERWLKEPDVHEHLHSPLEVLDPMLAKEGDSARSRGHGVVFRPFAVSFERTKKAREKIISLLSECLEAESTKVVFHALKSLTKTLNPPHGLLGRAVSEDEVAQWLPEQIKALEAIKSLRKITQDAIILLQIKKELIWHARRNSQEKIREKAKSIVESIPDSFDMKLCERMKGQNDMDLDEEGYEQYNARIAQETRKTAEELIERYKNGGDIFELLDGIIEKFKECSIETWPEFLLSELSRINEEIASEMCKIVISNPSSFLTPYFGSLLPGIIEKNKEAAIDLIRSAVATGAPLLCESVAKSYCWEFLASSIDKEDIEIIRDLLNNTNRSVLSNALESLRRFPKDKLETAVELAMGTEISDDEKLADTLCKIFDDKYGIPFGIMNEEKLIGVLNKIAGIKRLSSDLHHVDRFLEHSVKVVPEAVIDMLLQRMDLNEKRGMDFQPLPYTGFRRGLHGIDISPNYREILVKICGRALEQKSQDRFWLPKLFAAISNGLAPKSLEILDDWINSRDPRKIGAVALLIQDAPTGFVLSHPEFVSNMLEKSYQASDDSHRRVKSALFHSATTGARSGISGQPMPQDERLRDMAEEISRTFPAGSPSHKFYSALSKYAENEIRDQLARDEELFDE